MPNKRAKLGLDYATSAFQSILGVKGRTFGSEYSTEQGMSDGNQGVQWNIGVNRNREVACLGVNLEGMKYDGWPIARFIERELKHSKLLEIAPQMEGNTDIWVAFYRDAWQGPGTRPPIKEKEISQRARLSELSENGWKRVLEKAYACLDSSKNHRGRAKQKVTFIHSGEAERYVSPHLHIYTVVWDTTPQSESVARTRIQRGFEILKPVYEVVAAQSQ